MLELQGNPRELLLASSRAHVVCDHVDLARRGQVVLGLAILDIDFYKTYIGHYAQQQGPQMTCCTRPSKAGVTGSRYQGTAAAVSLRRLGDRAFPHANGVE